MDARAEIDKLTQAKQRAERRKDEEGIAALTEKIARKEQEVAELDEQIRLLNEAREQKDFEPDPDAPITLDFVQKDLHTVMHYIALRSGLQIIVEGEVSVALTVMFHDIKPIDAIESICKANGLEMVQDGTVIIIKKKD
jgi:hypothetical protein